MDVSPMACTLPTRCLVHGQAVDLKRNTQRNIPIRMNTCLIESLVLSF